jgi:4-hydroxy-tetrahydrodipicolinate reductase
VLRLDPGPDLQVLTDLDLVPRGPGVAVHAAGSRVDRILPTLEGLLDRGWHVVSTTEALFHPHPDLAARMEALDRRARDAGRVVVAGGVNPGLAMDVLPLTLASGMIRVDRVDLTRVLDTRTRRIPFQEKVCVGIEPEVARDRIARGEAGHVGLLNSALYLAEHLGWKVNRAESSVTPILAAEAIEGPIPVARGSVAGLEETLEVFEGERLRVTGRLVMAAGAGPAEDRVRLTGEPSLESVVVGGLPGDACTVGSIANLVNRVGAGAPGLRAPDELPLPWFSPRDAKSS